MKHDNKEENYVIGVDAGGTKTRAAAFDASGNLIAEAVSGCGNLALSYDDAKAEIVSAIRAVWHDKCQYLAVGAAGASAVDGISAASRLAKDLSREFGVQVDGMTDAELALTAAFGKSGDGMLVISGTGSVVFLRRDGKLYRAGGWGHIIGDGGSAYFTGIEAVRMITMLHDTGTPDDALEHAVFSVLGISDISHLTSYLYSPDRKKSDIAAIAPAIDALAMKENTSAANILWKSASSLAYDAAAVLIRSGAKRTKIALTGGHIQNSAILRDQFIESLKNKICGTCEIESVEIIKDPTYAAFRIYEKE